MSKIIKEIIDEFAEKTTEKVTKVRVGLSDQKENEVIWNKWVTMTHQILLNKGVCSCQNDMNCFLELEKEKQIELAKGSEIIALNFQEFKSSVKEGVSLAIQTTEKRKS